MVDFNVGAEVLCGCCVTFLVVDVELDVKIVCGCCGLFVVFGCLVVDVVVMLLFSFEVVVRVESKVKVVCGR